MIAFIVTVVVFVGGILVSYSLIQFYSEPPLGWPFPTWGPPTTTLYFPAIMMSFPLIIFICCMVNANRPHRAKMEHATLHRYDEDTVVDNRDYKIRDDLLEKKQKKGYLIPSECPSCNHSLSPNEIEWIGPLQAKCPYCGATLVAEVHG